MRKLLIVCVFVLILGPLSSSVFAIQYCKDLLEPGNTGGWGTSLKTFDEEWRVCHGIVLELDIWINDVPEPLLSAGFYLTASNEYVNFIDGEAYDDNDLPGPWQPGASFVITDNNEGFVLADVSNLQSPAPPDGDGDIIIAKVRFAVPCMTQTYITISTIPGYDTVVGESSTVYQITPNTIMVWEASWPCCCTYILTDDLTTIYPGETIDFDAYSSGMFCYPPSDLLFSDNCVQGDVDPITGLFTADATLAFEDCEVCVVDNANTGSCDDFLCEPSGACCADVTILGCIEEGDGDGDGVCNEEDNCPNTPNPLQEDSYPPTVGNGIGNACECEGNFNCSEDDDCDGSNAAEFKADFGRSSFNRPCTTEDPCNGDFSCRGQVDGSDAALFKSDFGRSSFNNPCPMCEEVVPWCSYPLP